MTKYVALAFVSSLVMQTAALADEVRSSTTEVQEGGNSSSSSYVSHDNDMGSSSTKTSSTKTIAPIGASRVTKQRTDSYSNDGTVQQKETKTETDINP